MAYRGVVLVFSVLLISLNVGCSVEHDMGQMLSNTEAMNVKTQYMSESMENLCQGGREDAMAGKVPQALTNLRNHEYVHDKLADAAVYIFSFEFQHWKVCIDGSEELRETLFTKALELLFADTYDLFDQTSRVPFGFNFSVDPLLPPKDEWKSLGVISYMIGRNDYNHEVTAKARGFKPISFYDLITEGLAMRDKGHRGEKIPNWALMVLQFEHRALQLLQLRHNFLPLMLLGHIDHFDKSILTQGRMRFSYWNYDFDSFNNEQLRVQIQYLREAEATRVFLRKIGEEVQWYSLMRKIFGNVQFTSKKNPLAAQILNNEVTDLTKLNLGVREQLAKELHDLWMPIATVQKAPAWRGPPDWNEWTGGPSANW